jgi:hypothetical protein
MFLNVETSLLIYVFGETSWAKSILRNLYESFLDLPLGSFRECQSEGHKTLSSSESQDLIPTIITINSVNVMPGS